MRCARTRRRRAIEDGVEGAFTFLHELSDKVSTGQWATGFLFTNAANRLNYFVGGEVMTLCHLDHAMYMLGYVRSEDRVYFIDDGQKRGLLPSPAVRASVPDRRGARRHGCGQRADQGHPREHSSVARFLESQGL